MPADILFAKKRTLKILCFADSSGVHKGELSQVSTFFQKSKRNCYLESILLFLQEQRTVRFCNLRSFYLGLYFALLLVTPFLEGSDEF